MALLIDGKRISQEIKDELKAEAAELKEKGIQEGFLLLYTLYASESECSRHFSLFLHKLL